MQSSAKVGSELTRGRETGERRERRDGDGTEEGQNLVTLTEKEEKGERVRGAVRRGTLRKTEVLRSQCERE